MENIVTKRLYLVPFTLELVKAAIIGNDELATLLSVQISPEWPDEELSQDLPFIADILDSKNPLYQKWAKPKQWGSLIIHKSENTLIGKAGIKVIPDETGSPTGSTELGYSIVPSYQRQGYASEAAKALIDWGFSQPDIQTITAGCNSDNIASKRVLEKVGMQLFQSREKMLIWKLSKTATVQ
ncbi:MAG: GNAT family protein [Rivularia sp. (in: cyanobacteria)]